MRSIHRTRSAVTELGVLSRRHASYDVNEIYLEGTYQRNESQSQGRFGASSTRLGAESRQNPTWKVELRSVGPLPMTITVRVVRTASEEDQYEESEQLFVRIVFGCVFGFQL
jgi:hypothetical protein